MSLSIRLCHRAFDRPTRLQTSKRVARLLVLCAAAAFAGDSAPLAQSPAGCPIKDGNKGPRARLYDSFSGPVPTHRFWAAKNWFATDRTSTGGAYTMFPEPLALQATSRGLRVGSSTIVDVQPSFFIHPIQFDFVVGLTDLHATAVSVPTYSDWTVDLDFGGLTARVGRGMPFAYFRTQGADPVVRFEAPPRIFAERDNILGVTVGQNHYGLFCPSGGTWSDAGLVLTCHLPAGKAYFSIAVLPGSNALDQFARYAFSFPEDTRVSWSYDPHSSRVTTVYTVKTRAMEGGQEGFVQALYPHQYASLAGGALQPGEEYRSARGTMKVIEAGSFTTVDTFHGILPYLPVADQEADRGLLERELSTVAGEKNHFPAPDTYGTGKRLDRLAELLPLARALGDEKDETALRRALEGEFATWFRSLPATAPPGYFYNCVWGTLIGLPGSYGSEEQLNDHHFHNGYWIHAAALLALYDSQWLNSPRTAEALKLLAGEIATTTRGDSRFPFLRHFDVYAGHSWASGQAPFADGENEESSSEAVNAWAGLILLATEIDDRSLRDAAIWMYTLETNAAFDYWFNDGAVKTFPEGFEPAQVANLFDGKSDTGTWFSRDPSMEHGIEFLPFTGGSLYLGRDRGYVRRNLDEVARHSPGLDLLSSGWPDLMEMYEAFDDPTAAIGRWRKTSFTFDGESRAHEYGWLTSMRQFGEVDDSVTADTPYYAVFRSHSGATHIAFNVSSSPQHVHFSDGAQITLPTGSYAINQQVLAIAR